MMGRCRQDGKGHVRYGKRGIKVCPEWHDYLTFKSWCQSSGYEPHLTLERIDNDGDYSPSNCRWATMKEQTNNRSTSRFITYLGETKTAAQWGELTGLGGLVNIRIQKLGWSIERAMTEPKKFLKPRKKLR